MGETIEFTEEKVKEYLDDCIHAWRRVRDNMGGEYSDMATYYVDAFQSVRVSLFGELLE